MQSLKFRSEHNTLKIQLSKAINGTVLEVELECLACETTFYLINLDQDLCWTNLENCLFDSTNICLHSVYTSINYVVAIDLDYVFARDSVIAHTLVLQVCQLIIFQEGEGTGRGIACSLFKCTSEDDHFLITCLSIII